MFGSQFLLCLVTLGLASARPLGRRQSTTPNPTELQVIQYALTLEQVENAFYTKYLEEFDESDFADAGYAPWVYGRMKQIGEHEQTHVSYLTSSMGQNAVQACKYTFPVTDVKSFVSLSEVLENVGAAAYTGASHYLTAGDAITAATAILATEARHAAWLQSAVQKQEPWSGSFQVPISMDQAYSLAVRFIVPGSCPSTNPILPIAAFPALNVTGSPVPGGNATLSFGATGASQYYLAIFSGLTTTYVPLTQFNSSNNVISAVAPIPSGMQGTVFAVVTTNSSAVTDDDTVAGPAVLSFPFLSTADNES